MELFERWQQTLDRHGGRTALVDFGDGGRRWTFAELAREVERLPRISGPLVERGRGVVFVLATLRAWRDRVPFVPLDGAVKAPDDLGPAPEWCRHVKSTSGSSGEPKWILFRAEQVAADADAIVETMGLTPEVTNLGVISMAHSYGFSNLVTPLLLHGVPLALVSTPLPAAVTATLNELERVVLPGVPAMWRAWHEAGIPRHPHLDLAISAGAPLPIDLEEAVFGEHGLKIHNFYGASECGGIAYDAGVSPRVAEAAGGSAVGRALRNVRLSIGPDGCLEVRGPAVGECYWPRPEDPDSDPDKALEAGCHRTQDLAEIRPDGEVVLTGRAGDAINVAGRKLAPSAVEEAVARHPAVRHCVAFGVPSRDPARVDDVVVMFSLRSGIPLSGIEETLRRHAGSVLESWQVPRHWIFDARVEPDDRGKIPRARWRDTFLHGR